MNTCDKCGAKYQNVCSNCEQDIIDSSDKKAELNLFPDNTDKIYVDSDPLRVTVADKIFGFGSIAGIVAAIVLTIIFSNKLHYVPDGIVMVSRQNYILEIRPVLFLSEVLFAFCIFFALFPKILWSLTILKIQRSAKVSSNIEPSDLWLINRKIKIFVLFFCALVTIFVSVGMFTSALAKSKEDAIAEQYLNEIYDIYYEQELMPDNK